MTPTPSQIVAALTVLANKRELFADSQNGMDAWALQYDACELIQKLQSENAALTSDLCKWRSAIQGMTPGGSEYMTVQSVEDFARNQKIECSKAKMESARLAKENAAMRRGGLWCRVRVFKVMAYINQVTCTDMKKVFLMLVSLTNGLCQKNKTTET